MPHAPQPAPRGMVASQHRLAVQAGLDMLEAGGSAADAAVAAAAVLTVVDPRSTGLGGDLFALYWAPGGDRPVGLASVGGAPAGLTVDRVRAAGFTAMPTDGPWSITVPGAPAGWQALLERHGKLHVGRVLEPAIRHAREGYRVTTAVADEWTSAAAKLDRNDAARATFMPGGTPPVAGELFAVPDLAWTLDVFAAEGAEPFYRGRLAARISAAVQELGGPLREEDLAGWPGPEWADPLHVAYRGVDVYEMPPPGQGLVVLEALRIYEGIATDDVVDADHAAIESVKLAHGDANVHLADPRFAPVPVDRLLSDEHIAAQRARVRPDAAIDGDVGRPSDTVYVAAVDEEGGACSFIQSVYDGFGSGVVVPGTGLALQNRGSGFTLADGHANRPEPGKRPYHTIIPSMMGRDGRFLGCLGVVGGYMQTQGQLQVLRNLLERGMTPQEAVDAPRFRAYRGRRLALEDTYDPEVARGLRRRGHEVVPLDRFERGGGQMVVKVDDGYVGGSDYRKDGAAAGR